MTAKFIDVLDMMTGAAVVVLPLGLDKEEFRILYSGRANDNDVLLL